MFEGHHCREDLLFVLHNQSLDLERALNGCGNFVIGESIDAFQHPRSLGHDHGAYEAGIVPGQAMLHEFRYFPGLNWIVTDNVANQDVSVESDHLRLPRR